MSKDVTGFLERAGRLCAGFLECEGRLQFHRGNFEGLRRRLGGQPVEDRAARVRRREPVAPHLRSEPRPAEGPGQDLSGPEAEDSRMKVTLAILAALALTLPG